MVSSRFRTMADPYVSRLVKPLVQTGLDPSILTLTGLLLSFYAAFLYAADNLILAAAMLAFASILDVLDGAMARLTGRVSAFGGFLDSLSDRYSDAAILIGIGIYLGNHYTLVLIVIVGSLLVSYTRARAEIEIGKCDVGWGERAERLMIILIATLLEATLYENALYVSLVLLAVLTHFTVAQRIVYTYRELKG